MHEICRVLQALPTRPGKLKTKFDLNVLCFFSYVAFFILVTISTDTLYVVLASYDMRIHSMVISFSSSLWPSLE